VGPAFQAAAGLRPGVDADLKVGGRLKARPHFVPVCLSVRRRLSIIALKIPDDLLSESGRLANDLRVSRAEYIRLAIGRMNRSTMARLRAKRISASPVSALPPERFHFDVVNMSLE
jgi:hypothetical protein